MQKDHLSTVITQAVRIGVRVPGTKAVFVIFFDFLWPFFSVADGDDRDDADKTASTSRSLSGSLSS
eukprot:COSAG03_NODE_1932_length_3335_cov_3.273148_4_plen_66_part_00